MIHQVEDGFAISSHGCWLPGCYATKEAARFAFQFPDETLQELQDQANRRGGSRMITSEDLRARKRTTEEATP